eukprot:928965_1
MDSGSAASGQSDCQATTSPMLQLTSKNEYSCATTLQQVNASTGNQMGVVGSRQLNGSSQIPQQSSPPQNPIKNAPPANYVCHNCNVMGHWIHKCPLTTPPANYVCHRCGVPGHWIKNCPTNGHPAFDNKPHLKVVKVRENGVNDMASTSSNAQPQEEKSTHGELKQQGSKSPQQIVIAKTNYITKNDHELALNNGDEIIVSNHIRIDSMDINRFCFCKNPLKRYKNKRNIGNAVVAIKPSRTRPAITVDSGNDATMRRQWDIFIKFVLSVLTHEVRMYLIKQHTMTSC